MKQLNRYSPGYTLIELLVVMAVLSILASVVLPLAEMTVQRERERELKRALWEIRDAIDAYRKWRTAAAPQLSGSASLPPDLATLAQAIPDERPDRRGEVHRFLRAIPRDPFADPGVPAEQSWGLRSYISEADQPLPGRDVYDVYSKSKAIGLNGVPLRQW